MAVILTRHNATHEALRDENAALREQLSAARQQTVAPGETKLFVNGQERKIGKKSQYLLDMLTLPEDK